MCSTVSCTAPLSALFVPSYPCVSFFQSSGAMARSIGSYATEAEVTAAKAAEDCRVMFRHVSNRSKLVFQNS